MSILLQGSVGPSVTYLIFVRTCLWRQDVRLRNGSAEIMSKNPHFQTSFVFVLSRFCDTLKR